MNTNHAPTPYGSQDETRIVVIQELEARVAELESALREIGDAMESDDDYNGRAAERYRIAARAALKGKA